MRILLKKISWLRCIEFYTRHDLSMAKSETTRQWRIVVCTILLLTVGLFSTSVQATITNITVMPASTNAPLGNSANVTVTWTVYTDGTYMSSPGGTFRDDSGNIFGTNSNRLYKTFGISTFALPQQVTETFVIPSQVIYKAAERGLSTFFYSRTFTDSSGSSSTWSVNVNITSSALGNFNISAMSLSFEDGSVVQIIQPKHKLKARAVINYSGTGQLQAVWEVANPVSTAVKPVYRPLMVVRQYLTGGGKQIITSPELPADIMGLYLVRLRITQPTPGFTQPLLRYVVSKGKPGEQLPVVPIGLDMPASGTLLVPDTLFAWQPVHGARVYEIVFYARAMTAIDKLPDLGGDSGPVSQTLPNSPPAAGIQISARQTRTVLSAATLSRLKPGKIYQWRVIAIDEKGNVIGVSAVRELRRP